MSDKYQKPPEPQDVINYTTSKPHETNFQRYFGTVEKAAEFLGLRVQCNACPMEECNGLASNEKCAKYWLDWLNAPAEDE